MVGVYMFYFIIFLCVCEFVRQIVLIMSVVSLVSMALGTLVLLIVFLITIFARKKKAQRDFEEAYASATTIDYDRGDGDEESHCR